MFGFPPRSNDDWPWPVGSLQDPADAAGSAGRRSSGCGGQEVRRAVPHCGSPPIQPACSNSSSNALRSPRGAISQCTAMMLVHTEVRACRQGSPSGRSFRRALETGSTNSNDEVEAESGAGSWRCRIVMLSPPMRKVISSKSRAESLIHGIPAAVPIAQLPACHHVERTPGKMPQSKPQAHQAPEVRRQARRGGEDATRAAKAEDENGPKTQKGGSRAGTNWWGPIPHLTN